MVEVSEEHDTMSGTCGSCIVSSAYDLLENSVVRWMRGE